MNPQELTKNIANLIQQFLQYDKNVDKYRQIPVFLESRQYFVERMSTPALFNNTSYILSIAKEVSSDELSYIIADANDLSELKAIYRVTNFGAFKIDTNNKEVPVGDINEITNFVMTLQNTLTTQLVKQTESSGHRLKMFAQKELEEDQKVVQFIRTFVELPETRFKLTGNRLIGVISGTSIPNMIMQYVNQARSFLHAHELLLLEQPVIIVEFTPELLTLFESMSPESQKRINRLLVIDEAYLTLFELLKRQAVYAQ